MNSQKREAPKLNDVALGGRISAQRYRFVPVVISPTPDFAAQLLAVLVDRIP